MNKFIILFSIAIGLIGCSKVDKNESSTNSINSEKRTENGWEVIINKDEMRQQEKKWLAVRSENNADLQFPYDGENHLQLDILDSKTNEPRIFFTIDKGQYDCGRYGCDAYIKFGANPVQHIELSIHDVQGTDGKILAFHGNTAAFITNIRKFNSIIIEIPFYRNGTRQFKFNTAGFTEAESKL